MYIICKFFEDWRIYDLVRKTRRPMTPELAEALKGLLGEQSKVVDAWQINPLPPNKLQQLQDIQESPAPRKPTDPAQKT